MSLDQVQFKINSKDYMNYNSIHAELYRFT
jgi:hypothetical protein